jgi:hypothetical protein
MHQPRGKKIKSQVVFFAHSNPSADIPQYGSTVRIFYAQAADEMKWSCVAAHEGGDRPDASATLITRTPKTSSSASIRSTFCFRALKSCVTAASSAKSLLSRWDILMSGVYSSLPSCGWYQVDLLVFNTQVPSLSTSGIWVIWRLMAIKNDWTMAIIRFSWTWLMVMMISVWSLVRYM